MLQQTTVSTVMPRYERFLRQFPSLRALARARPAQVLRAWAGLGYYARARGLHAAARRMVAEHGGRVPDREPDLAGLPGFGRYTTGAVLSIAFQKPYAVLDGNIARVLCRLRALKGDPKSPNLSGRLWKLAQSLVPPHRPGDWNQAMMELGATVCLPAQPRCAECPVRRHCRARRLGWQERLPETPRAPTPRRLEWDFLWIENHGKVLLTRRGPGRLLQGQWGFPEASDVKTSTGPLLGRASHSITHHRIAARLHRASLSAPPPAGTRWVPTKKLEATFVSSLWRKLAELRP